ncbi:MAG: hypothetical protein A3C70_00275 [Candidatus Zambryskibacteria bacterium RIFCSPHIGHO2_02_FULL_43_14]|uniref:Dystroglycan-type cadherin-like domain-containing protein n=1 Tax=Candidatus Zambryskibacteria bacterium RIFCSPHIGHO2_02_FULL_43_14 TaxID=1802748 RepID=A0A1G2TFI6_9BACT|nr:MAG: hypothetical protein A3C70_00275 [Candidatus Zambryskibacteria bacterium RIFCSPHIGHO2_02_FULL_43_14]OHB03291.1 MAG: hypothetical protein A3B03_00615 [Candidatus Zambryskibacteria bacterium RIFCSPLOWO2_01_FULL_42_41]
MRNSILNVIFFGKRTIFLLVLMFIILISNIPTFVSAWNNHSNNHNDHDSGYHDDDDDFDNNHGGHYDDANNDDCNDETPPPVVTVDIKVNDSDGPITINNDDSYTYSWISTGATACILTSPTGESEISLSGVGDTILSGHPWYPATSSPVTLILSCTNGTSTTTDSVLISLTDIPLPPPPSPSCPLPEITSGLSATATINQPFSYTLTATTTGVTATTTSFAAATSSLPQGLNFSTSTATISGIPTETGTFNVAISTTNDCGTDSETLVLTVNPASNGGGGPSCALPEITSPLTASTTINQIFSYTITATTTGASATTTIFSVATSSLPLGLSFSTTTGTISGTTTQTGTFNVVISATGDCGTDTETLVITVNPVASDNNDDGGNGGSGGGGGGGSSSTSSRSSSGGGGSSRSSVASSIVPAPECFYLRDFMRIDFNNDPVEVLKLQAFLINFEGNDNVALTGVFDQATFEAVSAFQMKYFSDILEPWGHTEPTGYVYILTIKKINEIYCQRIFPLSQVQLNEIIAYRALLDGLKQQGINVELPTGIGGGEDATNTESLIPVIGGASPLRGQILNNLATAIFAQPETLLDTIKCLYGLILILILLYIIGNVLQDILYKNIPPNTIKRFLAKWLTIDVGLVVSIVGAYMFGRWCLILPLLIAFIISLVWTLTYSKHNSMRASVKSWYLVGLARMKSILKETKESPKIPITPIKEGLIKRIVKKEPAESVEEEIIKETEVIILGPEK